MLPTPEKMRSDATETAPFFVFSLDSADARLYRYLCVCKEEPFHAGGRGGNRPIPESTSGPGAGRLAAAVGAPLSRLVQGTLHLLATPPVSCPRSYARPSLPPWLPLAVAANLPDPRCSRPLRLSQSPACRLQCEGSWLLACVKNTGWEVGDVCASGKVRGGPLEVDLGYDDCGRQGRFFLTLGAARSM